MVKPQRRATLLGYELPPGATEDHTTEGSAKRPDHFALRRTGWSLSVDAIIKKLNIHASFPVQEGYELVDLPRFTDTLNYQVSEEEQFELWKFEVRRLVAVANSAEPLELEGQDEWFGEANRAGYLKLDKLATQLSYATSICILDNELLLLEFDPSISNPTNFQVARSKLVRMFASGPGTNDHHGSIRLDRENDRCYQALVNYVTGTLVKVLLRAVEGQVWDDNVVIALAKLATKLKVMGFDVERSAKVSLSGADEWDRRLRHELQKDFPLPSVDKESSNPRDQQLSAVKGLFGHGGHEYFKIMDAFHQCIAVLIQQVASDLRSDPATTAITDSFEACSIVYDTGFQQARALLCQQRAGAIGGSGNLNEVHCVGFAFEVCLAVLAQLKKDHPEKPPEGDKAYASVYWTWTRILAAKEGDEGTQLGESQIGEVHLVSMRHVATAFVPFVMICGEFPRQLRPMLGLVHSMSKPGATTKTCDDVPFLASFMLRTSNYRSTASSDWTSLGACTIARKRALAQWPAAVLGDTPEPLGLVRAGEDNSALRKELREANARAAEILKKMDSWIIDETSIIIPYRRYCWGTLGLCAALVLGGLAIGLSVQTRIDGVDPFNISTFCWVLAGFLILVAKSIRVQEWPWRDFFLGRVVCKSVSEVVAVSSVDAQLLLSMLLRLEPVMLLNKRGPFETIFTRRNPETGFAIDIPLGTAAMNEGGCFLIRVQSNTGPAIVCMRANYGQGYNGVKPHDNIDDSEEVSCSHLDTPWRWGKGPEKGVLYPLRTNGLSWTRVIGLQCDNAYFD